jgi:hypothetical protein
MFSARIKARQLGNVTNNDNDNSTTSNASSISGGIPSPSASHHKYSSPGQISLPPSTIVGITAATVGAVGIGVFLVWFRKRQRRREMEKLWNGARAQRNATAVGEQQARAFAAGQVQERKHRNDSKESLHAESDSIVVAVDFPKRNGDGNPAIAVYPPTATPLSDQDVDSLALRVASIISPLNSSSEK